MATTFHNFLTQGDSLTNTRIVLSNPSGINVTMWSNTGGTWTLPTTNQINIPLENIVRDSLTISQDDPEESTIDCETSDSPIKTVTKQGAWHIEMTCADLQEEIVTNLLGYESITNEGGTPTGTNPGDYLLAPTSTPDLYAAIEILFESQSRSLVCPRVKLTSKLDASSLSSETVKITISGTLEEYEIPSATPGTGSGKKGPFFINQYVTT